MKEEKAKVLGKMEKEEGEHLVENRLELFPSWAELLTRPFQVAHTARTSRAEHTLSV